MFLQAFIMQAKRFIALRGMLFGVRYSILPVLLPLLFASGQQAYAATYYVDNLLGRDRSAGTEALPWATLNHAVAQLRAGDTLVIVGNGPAQPYREAIAIKHSGEHGQAITIKGGDGLQRPVVVGLSDWSDDGPQGNRRWRRDEAGVVSLFGVPRPAALWASTRLEWEKDGVDSLVEREQSDSTSLLPGQWSYSDHQRTLRYSLQSGELHNNLHLEAVTTSTLLAVNNRHYINVSNLRFKFASGVAVSLPNGSSHLLLDNIHIEQARKNGISARGGEHIKIANCVVHDISNNGIYFGGSKENKLSNSSIRGCSISTVRNNDCISVHKDMQGNDIGSGIVLENNILTDCAEQGIDVTSGSNVRLLGNTTFGNGDSGILLGHDVTDILVKNHLSVDDGRYAGILVHSSRGVTLAENCIMNSEKHQLVLRDTATVRVEGNVVYQAAERRGSLIDIAQDTGSIVFVDNLVISDSLSGSPLIRYLQGSDPVSSEVLFTGNVWSAVVAGRYFYTDTLNRHSFAQHAAEYARSPQDKFVLNLGFEAVVERMGANGCDLGKVPAKHLEWLP